MAENTATKSKIFMLPLASINEHSPALCVASFQVQEHLGSPVAYGDLSFKHSTAVVACWHEPSSGLVMLYVID